MDKLTGNVLLEMPALLVLFGRGCENIVTRIADVIGQPHAIATTRKDAGHQALATVVGVLEDDYLAAWKSVDPERIVINAHCVDNGRSATESLTPIIHYEYLYTTTPFYNRDLSRYLSFILGQLKPHQDLSRKERTTLLSTTFPDVNAALPNLEILSVGADAIELRVDLLRETLENGSYRPIPSIRYVAEQFMTLRQRTELPIIYTTRCTNENGRFPMDNPELFYQYLYKAIQWGCEYIDVELWLPEEIRRLLSLHKGSSTIISAFHDFSGNLKWTAPEAQALFEKGAVYGDVVKMIVYVTTVQENYDLEYFRSKIQAEYPQPPLSGLNMGPQGQISRCFNKIFTPITHPLLPMIAAPGQISAAEINTSLHSMGQMAKLDFYGLSSSEPSSGTPFFEKCFNELGLLHRFIEVRTESPRSISSLLQRSKFGGAYINPPLGKHSSKHLTLAKSSQAMGVVDTIVVRSDGSQQTFVGENASWKGIRATLTRDFVPSAYAGRAALVLANSEQDAASSIFALKSLRIGQIYTIGFKSRSSLASDLTPVTAVEELREFDHPFIIINALPGDKSLAVGPLLKHYGSGNGTDSAPSKVFVNLANGPKKADPSAIARSLGWSVFGPDEVQAWTTVEILRLLVGQNVPYDFVRLAMGRSSF